MLDKVIVPIGFKAGEVTSLENVLCILQMEMIGHHNDLLHLRDRAEEPDEMMEYQAQADLVEKYATVITSIYYQVIARPVNPKNYPCFIELAAKHHIRIPEYFHAGA